MRHLPLPLRVLPVILAVVTAATLLPGRSTGAGATLSLSPASKSVIVGQTVTVSLVVNTGGVAINAAEATITFPKDLLSVKSISKDGSIFTLWAVDPVAGSGTITLAGGKPSPGYTGSSGRIITVTFTTKEVGSATLGITGASVLANDGLGTNVLASVGSAVITVKKESQPTNTNTNTNTAPAPPSNDRPAATILVPTHPDAETWYAAREVNASWSAGSGVLSSSAAFDQSATTVPPETNQDSGTTFSRTQLADGTWYLHVRVRYASGWSATTHRKILVDATAPNAFSITRTQDPAMSRRVVLSFETTDATSGIARYEFKLDGGDFAVTTSPATLDDLESGEHTVLIHAVDHAGNVAEASTTFSIVGPPVPAAALVAPASHLRGADETVATLVVGEQLRLRGFARLTDTIHIVVRSQESVFDFPVADIVDPNPVVSAPEGLTAWTVEIRPNLEPGDHEVHVTAIDADGVASAEAPVLHFRVVTNVARFGDVIVPYRFIIQVLLIAVGVLFVVTMLALFGYIRIRRELRWTRSQFYRNEKRQKRFRT